MRESFERYYANIKEANDLVRPKISSGLPRDELLEVIHANAERLTKLKYENDEFLRDNILTADPSTLTAEDIAELSELADILFHNATGCDIGIAYKIHSLIYKYAEYYGKRDLMIKELYYQGLTLYYLHFSIGSMKINTNGKELYDYYCRGASYINQYEDIEDENTRGYIIRCLGNRKYGHPAIKGDNDWIIGNGNVHAGYDEYSKIFGEAMAVICSEHYRSLNPGLPWSNYEYAMHFDRTAYLSSLRVAHEDKIESPLIERMKRDVLESAEYVYNHQEEIAKRKHQSVGVRTRYVYAAAKFHAGKADIKELVDILLETNENAGMNDYTQSGITANIGFAVYASHYSEYMNSADAELYQPRIKAAMNRAVEFFENFPNELFGEYMSHWVGELVREQTNGNSVSRTHIMETMILCHTSTYVHSVMVAYLTRAIFEEAVRTDPKILGGVFEAVSAEEIIANRAAYAKRAYLCGLYHDVGKSSVLAYITTYGRKLLDEEFEVIKYHPVMGYSLLKNFDELEIEAEVALKHHLWYNGRGGYPVKHSDTKESARAIIDIVAIADSLDAATDNIGRSYAQTKTFEALVDELRQGSGTRYSPDIVMLFDNADFCTRLKENMSERRKNVYCRAYEARRRIEIPE